MLSLAQGNVLPETATLANHLQILLGSWFGAGFLEPVRAGLAVASVWPLAVFLSGRAPMTLALVAIAVGLVGFWAADAWETLLSVKDDRRIVVDEVAGYLAGMALLGRPRWICGAIFAVFFLSFDRIKPWPFSGIEAVPGGAGLMLDDIVLALALSSVTAVIIVARRRFGNA
ncbi:phosphatidylglycerophosphatase A family protein [Pseudosulfitobacter koreensis]|uniref:Phosphatidylglycerophosphatase A n=1 Tax=Pseudosulfitobacter koreensis TaxID=2968472 RepID=A0ABT1YZN5_9RHOB|nr:phosphatidylglycerophosphatase A [Pseudosulfitobacter koreense]MCR8826350.1 phosphatidylglycerophosphatase A [Pseudosulfitobacter koreense]